jgi:hypothetical protein
MSTSKDIVNAIGSTIAAAHIVEGLISWSVFIFHVNFFHE